jgi:hypothetical protein
VVSVRYFATSPGLDFWNGETAMAMVIAQSRKLSEYFARVGQRLYDARLASANREVERHRQFLALKPF